MITGDGDCLAIGGNHLIHAARRNVDLLVVCVNNFTYGMTGGQYSPTTPIGGKATTAPYGNVEPPFPVCELAIAAGATYVARSTVYHALELDKFLAEAIAKGWQPSARDLGVWRELRCITTDTGGMAVNCYLVWDEVSREAALFDTGWESQPVTTLIAENQLQLRHIFITHAHEDHLGAVPYLWERLRCPVYATLARATPVEVTLA